MPKSYTRKTYKGRTYRPGRSYAGKSLFTIAKAFAKPGAKLATKYMKKALGLNTEMKWLDTVETAVGIGSTAANLSFPLTIPQGDTVNTRDGNSVRLTSYICRLRIQANAAATTPCMVRIVFFKVKDVRGDNPGPSTILDSTFRITSHYNMCDSAAAAGYTVLFDRTIEIPLYTSNNATKLITFRYTPLDHHLKWSSADTTGSYANLTDGYVRGFIMTSETGANTPSYWADHRVKFVDN